MNEPLTLLHTPLGVPGSGRVRYGAAMALYRAGQLSEAQLDVYREASAHDSRDPAALLAERNLPAPPPAVNGREQVMSALLTASCDYLATLDHPGAGEVRMGLAAVDRACRPTGARMSSVVERWLPPALAQVRERHPTLADAIGAASPFLDWVTYDSYPRKAIGEAFATGHAFASIAGESGPFPAEDFDLGIFLIAPHVLYRDHRHPAPELYAPLTGPHGWRFGPDRPLLIKRADTPVWNTPLQPHLTKVGAVPFLALFVWTKDVNLPAEVIPAGDWPELEAAALG